MPGSTPSFRTTRPPSAPSTLTPTSPTSTGRPPRAVSSSPLSFPLDMSPSPPAAPAAPRADRRWPVLPEDSLAAEALPSIDYLDVFSTPVDSDATLDEVARRLLLGQPPRLMRLRDALVRPFGLKTSPKGSRPALRLVPGERIGIFRLYARSAHELLL